MTIEIVDRLARIKTFTVLSTIDIYLLNSEKVFSKMTSCIWLIEIVDRLARIKLSLFYLLLISIYWIVKKSFLKWRLAYDS